MIAGRSSPSLAGPLDLPADLPAAGDPIDDFDSSVWNGGAVEQPPLDGRYKREPGGRRRTVRRSAGDRYFTPTPRPFQLAAAIFYRNVACSDLTVDEERAKLRRELLALVHQLDGLGGEQ